MDADKPDDPLIAPMARIVAAYVSRHDVDDLPGLMREVYDALAGISGGQAVKGALRTAQRPVVPIEQSVTPDYIICLEDGKKLKMLKRYLKTAYNLTPAQYREKWGLPADYPMTAPNYAQKRSSLAKEIGLGTNK